MFVVYKSLCRTYIRAKNYIIPKVLHNRLISSSLIGVISAGALQGYYVRQRWLSRPEELKMDVDPDYPTSGTIKIKSKLHDIESHIVEMIKEKKLVKDLLSFLDYEVADKLKLNAKEKIDSITMKMKKMSEIEKVKNIASEFSLIEYVLGQLNGKGLDLPAKIIQNRLAQTRKTPIKLILLGDSLVCGVGCDKNDSKDGPVMPRVLASVLSIAFGVDVEWESHGIVGSTVGEIRNKLLPQVLRKVDNSACSRNGEKIHNTGVVAGSSYDDRSDSGKDNARKDHIVLIICGLNDWKTMFTEFPNGKGPKGFAKELFLLVDDIKSSPEIGKMCRIYLPAMPIELGTLDEKSSFNVFPLSFFVESICKFWDRQKRLMIDSSDVVYINEPKLSGAMKAFGNSVVSMDGVHPNSLGYKFWGIHLAKEIIRSMLDGDSVVQ